MGHLDFLFMCFAAFLGVFILLTILAIIQRLIVALFPEKDAGVEEVIVAAISTAAGAAFPGTKVTKIEEIK